MTTKNHDYSTFRTSKLHIKNTSKLVTKNSENRTNGKVITDDSITRSSSLESVQTTSLVVQQDRSVDSVQNGNHAPKTR